MGEKLTKTDEAYLLNNMDRFWRLILQQVRSGRTQLQRTLRMLEVADRKWPDEGVAERAKMRDEAENGIRVCDRTEAAALAALADLDAE